MSPAEFCPFAVQSPQLHFVGCPLFADGESRIWTLAALKERLQEIATLYIQCNYGMQIGPWYEQRQAFGARDANLSHFIQKFRAVVDSDRFRTAVRVKYRGDLTAKLIDEVVTDLVFGSNGTLSISAAEKLTLGAAATKLRQLVSPATPPVDSSASSVGQFADNALSLAGLTARATAAYSRTKGNFLLVACPGQKLEPELQADEVRGLNGQFVKDDDPNSWRIIDGTIFLPFSSTHYLGFTSIQRVGPYYLVLGSSRGSGLTEIQEFAAFAKDAGALLRSSPPPELTGGCGLSPDTFWAALLMFWSPAATEAVACLGDCQVIRQPWAASLIALRALRIGAQSVDESSNVGTPLWAAGGGQPTMPTIWYHGGRSYSADGLTPINLPREQHDTLRAFLDSEVALDTAALAQAGANNVTKVVKAIEEKFPGTVRRPANKGDGYFIRVRTKTATR